MPPQPPPGPRQQPPPPRPPKKKGNAGKIVAFCAVGFAVVVVFGIVGFLLTNMVLSPNEDDTASGPPPKPEGALRHQAGKGQPASFNGAPMFDACALLPVDSIEKYGLKRKPEGEARHTYFDKATPGGIDKTMSSFSSECGYGLNKPAPDGMPGSVSLTVEQVPYASSPSDDPVSDAHILEQRDEAGAKIFLYQVPDESDTQVLIVRPDLSMDLTLTGKSPDRVDTARRMATDIARKIQQGPTAPVEPKWTGEFQGMKDPCAVLSPEAVEAAFGKPASGQASARYRVSPSHYFPKKGPMGYRIEAGCRRGPIEPGGLFASADSDAYANINTLHWQNEDQARAYRGDMCSGPNPLTGEPSIPVDMPVGDDPVCASMSEGNARYVIRIGRTIVEVQSSPMGSVEQTARALTPMAKVMERNLRG